MSIKRALVTAIAVGLLTASFAVAGNNNNQGQDNNSQGHSTSHNNQGQNNNNQ